MKTLLITSGTYVDSELQAEFGPLPPSFLPVGGRRLVEHQIERIDRTDTRVFLTVPIDFAIGEDEAQAIDATLLRLDPSLSLGASVALAIEAIGTDAPLEIIHGDTLVTPPRITWPDAMAVADISDGYHWATAQIAEGKIRRICDASDIDTGVGTKILTGYFRFSRPDLFLDLLEKTGQRFVQALAAYAELIPVGSADEESWLDFGHLQTFFRSRHHMAASRHFNALAIDGAVVVKSSDQVAKIDAEAHWLRSVPPSLQIYTARLIEDRAEPATGRYATEYSFLPTVSEISLSRLGRNGWSRILDAADEYLLRASMITDPLGGDGNLRRLAIDKTRDRLAAHPAAFPDMRRAMRINGAAVPPGLEILDHLERIIEGAPHRPSTVMHGDFCFSNLLYNSRNQRLCLIDPRGFVEDGHPSIYGDIRYDIAKFGHSIVGRYDQIIAGQYRLEEDGSEIRFTLADDPTKIWLEEQFLRRSLNGLRFDSPEILATIVSLFLSMIPLHAEDASRQRAFYANAFRLYHRFFGLN